MGTNGPQSRRASRRGLASFVAFLLLFAFALGQSGSLKALAGGDSRGSALPAPQAPATDVNASTSSGGATPVTRSAPTAGKLKTASVTRDDAVAAPAAPPGGAYLDGGDIGLNYAAAGPFSYNHTTAVGGAWGDGHNSKTDGIVESLESGDFQCDDLVVFFTEVTVSDGAGSAGAIQLDYSFGAETTGQPGLGFTDIWSVGINTGDSGMTDTGAAATAVLTSETNPPGGGYDQILGVVDIGGLDPGDVIIVRLVARLGCIQGSNPTGNILNAIEDGRVTSPTADNIPVGQQTVPMKSDGFVAAPSIFIVKDCPAPSLFGDDITYDITITNDGNEDLDTIVVTDTVNGNAPVPVAGFPSTLAAGATFTGQFTYSPGGTEPDPLPNSATVTAQGVESNTQVTDTDGCSTDILNPDIDVTKTCTATAQVGDTITYTITVKNTGDETLENVTVNDTLLGNLSGSYDDVFSPDEEESHDFTYPVTVNSPDPVPNSVTASGVGVTSEDTVTDTASCSTNVLHPAINIVKDGPALVHVDDTITYTFEVTNPGELELFDVVLSDPICDAGTIVAAADVDSSLSDGGEEVWHFSCTHLVTDVDEDPLPNTATITGDTSEGEGGNQVTDTDDHLVDIIHPGISIVKTVDEEIVPIGTTVTFTYVILNTGDTTLYDVSVDDDILGHVGDIAVLEPGIPVTLTKDFVVGDEPVTNVGTAVGEDILGRSVNASDDATVAPIAGENPPPNNPPTPFTGSDAGRLGLITMVLFGIGVTVVASTRRRRTEREAA